MARFNYIASSFSSGELTPKLDARTDIEQYFKGVKKLENMFVMKQGGAVKRPGSRFITDLTGDESNFFDQGLTSLHPFIFSKDEKYTVAISVDGPLADIMFVIKQDGTLITPSGLAIIQGTTAADDPYGWHLAQTGDTIIFVHNSGKQEPIILQRTAQDAFRHYNWTDTFTFKDTPLGVRFPLRDVNTTATTITPGLGSGLADTLEASTAIFDAGHVGSVWRIDDIGAGKSGLIEIGTVVDSLNATGNWLVDLGTDPATDAWYESSWSNFRGWPRTVCFFENRLIFGGNNAQPDKIWGGLKDNTFHFMEPHLIQDATTDASKLNYVGPVVETDPFSYTPATQEINRIEWIRGAQNLQVGTTGAEYTFSGTNDKILSNEAVQVRSHTRNGSSSIQPERVGNGTMYYARDGKSLREFVLDVESNSYVSRDISILSDDIINHLFDGSGEFAGVQAVQLSYQENRKVLWVLNNRFGLIGLTFDKSSGVTAWHRHVIGGADVKVRSIASIPGPDGSTDELWLLVERTVNGGTVLYLEKIGGDDFEHSALSNTSANEDDHPWFSDSSVRATGSGLTTFPGYSHLEGETVKVLRDGFVHADVVVAGGNVVVDTASDEVIAGLQYKPFLQTMRLEVGGHLGSAQAETKRIDRAVVRFYKTFGAKVGRDLSNLEAAIFRPPSLPMGDPLPLFTGDKRINFDSEPDKEAYVVITQDEPLPLTVLGIVLRGTTYGS